MSSESALPSSSHSPQQQQHAHTATASASASASASGTSLPGSPSTAATEPHQRRSPQPLALPQLTTAPEPEPDADSARSTPTLAFPPSPDLSSPRAGGLAASLSVPQRPGQNRGRSSSLLKLEHIKDSHDVMLDQNAGFNANADWVNHKGAWVVHIVLILAGKILLDVVPGITQDVSWTLVNLGYIGLTFLMFHHVTGTPFQANAGAYDELTLWEQIDEGAQHTPAKKWLTSVPIGLFLISTHYTKYNLWLFTLNFCALLFVLFPKLPILHRLRFKVLPSHFSGPPTPNISRAPTPISRTGTPISHSGRRSPRPF